VEDGYHLSRVTKIKEFYSNGSTVHTRPYRKPNGTSGFDLKTISHF